MDPFWIVVVSFAAGCVIGVFVTLVTRRDKGAKALEQELLELRQEYENYRVEVGNHFVETSNLINQMTQSYRDVHQHLSKGAQNLCDPDLAKQLREETAPLIEHVVDSAPPDSDQSKVESPTTPATDDESELRASYDAMSVQTAELGGNESAKGDNEAGSVAEAAATADAADEPSSASDTVSGKQAAIS